MEKVKDFFEHIYERISSPFFSSFAIAWIFSNWRIPVGLFFYSHDEIERDGYGSFIQMIVGVTNWRDSLIIPLFIALAYTFAYPYLRAYISTQILKARKWEDEQHQEVNKGRWIKLDTYLELNDSLEKQGAYLSELINTHAATKVENEDLKIQVHNFNSGHQKILEEQTKQYRQEISELKKELSKLSNKMLPKSFDGQYRMTFHETGDANSKETATVQIEDGNIRLQETGRSIFSLSGFFFDPHTNQYLWILSKARLPISKVDFANSSFITLRRDKKNFDVHTIGPINYISRIEEI